MATEKNAAQHLHEFHKAAHEHHSEMIAAHKTELGKASRDRRDFHEAAIAAHLKMQVHHADGMAETQKAMVDALNKTNEVLQTRVSAVAPDLPTGLRSVIRPGQPSFGTGMPSMPKVELQFEHLVKVD